MGVPLPLPTQKISEAHGAGFSISLYFVEVNTRVGEIHTPHSHSRK